MKIVSCFFLSIGIVGIYGFLSKHPLRVRSKQLIITKQQRTNDSIPMSDDNDILVVHTTNTSNPNNKYPLSQKYFNEHLKRLNSKNTSTFDKEVLEGKNIPHITIKFTPGIQLPLDIEGKDNREDDGDNGDMFGFGNPFIPPPRYDNDEDNGDDDDREARRNPYQQHIRDKASRSANFEVITEHSVNFSQVAGYDNIKLELMQCVDIMKNSSRYEKFNVRTPKGVLLHGPPGVGKTFIAKALAGEAGMNFIYASGSGFQHKYVGMGPARVKELFSLAKKNRPCIIFVDEIDSLGRKRSGDGEESSSERDSTLNELLASLDGFASEPGIFLVGATNRQDMLDDALTRPGRIDKSIHINLPDFETRKQLVSIYIKGKPYDSSIRESELSEEYTRGLSCAEIENLLNEAMLYALLHNREKMSFDDLELVMSKMMVGWQPTEHAASTELIHRTAIHEMGHVLLGLLAENHNKVKKVVINLNSPKSPAYTMFEQTEDILYTREQLFERLVVLMGGYIAEYVVFGNSVTTGASDDLNRVTKLAEDMVLKYGMGEDLIYPQNGEKSKNDIDIQMKNLIDLAYKQGLEQITQYTDYIVEMSDILQRDKVIYGGMLSYVLHSKYLKPNSK